MMATCGACSSPSQRGSRTPPLVPVLTPHARRLRAAGGGPRSWSWARSPWRCRSAGGARLRHCERRCSGSRRRTRRCRRSLMATGRRPMPPCRRAPRTARRSSRRAGRSSSWGSSSGPPRWTLRGRTRTRSRRSRSLARRGDGSGRPSRRAASRRRLSSAGRARERSAATLRSPPRGVPLKPSGRPWSCGGARRSAPTSRSWTSGGRRRSPWTRRSRACVQCWPPVALRPRLRSRAWTTAPQ
mmetsp:Transcript_6183/g.19816  ORF Transcript_6183/g.19816 Transcript_6183/m.19816 type:complete len:242 (+) Transcript_6183:365-1090(+)